MTPPERGSDDDRPGPLDDRLRLQVHLGEHVASIRLAGALTETSVVVVTKEIGKLIATGLYRRIAVDMRSVSSCDPAALGALANVSATAGEAGTPVVVTNPSEALDQALTDAGLHGRLTVARQEPRRDRGDHR